VRRIAGGLLTVIGVVLLIIVGATQARAALARDRARSAWAAEEAHLAAEAARRPQGAAVRPSARGAPIGRLVIPSIGLDEVFVEGVEERQLVAGPGHLPGSPFPGETGTAIVSAHRDRHFRALDGLTIGDTIVTQTRQHRVVWRIAERRVVSASAPVLRGASDARLTLTTCWPVRYLGPAPDRLILTAVPVTGALAAATQ
jgi:LPXTG-site transpeptidase (sortase) family protein